MADKNVNDELAQLSLEKTRFEVQNLRGQENTRKLRARAVEAALKADIERTQRTISACAHRKGGKGLEMIYRGNDHNYAVVKHQLPHGPIIVICQRCPKVWTPPDPALIAKGATAEDRAEYKQQLRE